jgi:HAE1 family hydrophobic/amphiphilic exporter-1
MTAPPSYKKVNPADSPVLMLSLRSETMPVTAVDDYGDLFLAQRSRK